MFALPHHFSWNRRTLTLLAVLGGVICLGLAAVVWRVERSLHQARSQQGWDADLGVEVRAVNPQPNPGFEPIGAPAVFKSAAVYEGKLYLSGPQGLSVYTLNGDLEKVYRVGMELPTAPLGRMAVGMVAGASRPELLMATAGAGVLAFDGAGFRQIVAKTEDARTVTALLPLASGRLLLGTAKLGVLVFDGRTLRRFHPTLDNLYVTALAGSESSLSVGTLNDGLLLWRGGETIRLGEEQGLPDSRVEALAMAGDTVFAGTPVGVAEVRQGKVARTVANGLFAHALLLDGEELLVGQMDAQIARLRWSENDAGPGARRPIQALSTLQEKGAGQQVRHGRAAASESNSSADGQAVEEFLISGSIRYALTGNALLERTPDGAWRKMLAPAPAQLSDRNISSLAVASDGRLWVGFFDRGLDILSANGRETAHVENEQVFCVNRIVENQREGAVAVATANGLVLFSRDGRQRQVLGKDSGLIAQHVTDVALYQDGMALATPAGITFLDPGGAHSIYAFEGLVNNHVYALGVGGDRLLAGTLGGISLVQVGLVQRNFTVANSGLKHNWITALVPAGSDWLVGTYGAGIERLSASGQITATDATGQGIVINPTAMASDGQLVVAGTLGRGLMVADATGSRWRTVTAGLPSLNVTAIAFNKDTVYVGTDNGLVRIVRAQL
jgi:ligand-binding sensor domain-containing protein